MERGNAMDWRPQEVLRVQELLEQHSRAHYRDAVDTEKMRKYQLVVEALVVGMQAVAFGGLAHLGSLPMAAFVVSGSGVGADECLE